MNYDFVKTSLLKSNQFIVSVDTEQNAIEIDQTDRVIDQLALRTLFEIISAGSINLSDGVKRKLMDFRILLNEDKII